MTFSFASGGGAASRAPVSRAAARTDSNTRPTTFSPFQLAGSRILGLSADNPTPPPPTRGSA